MSNDDGTWTVVTLAVVIIVFSVCLTVWDCNRTNAELRHHCVANGHALSECAP